MPVRSRTRQVLEGAHGLDLEHDAVVAAAECREAPLELEHVLRLVQEGHADQVGPARRAAQDLAVRGGQRWQGEARARQVDALVAAQLAAAGRAGRDLDLQARRVGALGHHGADQARDLAVVEVDRLARARVAEDLGQRAADLRRSARRRRTRGPFRGHEPQGVAGTQHERRLDRGQRAHRGSRQAVAAAHEPDLEAGLEPHALQEVREAPAGPGAGDHELAPAAAQVAQRQRVAGRGTFQQGRAQRQAHVVLRRAVLAPGDEEDARGAQGLAARAALGLQVQRAGPRRERGGTQLGAGKVDQHAARAPEGLRRRARVPRDALPHVRVVVRRVDARAVHAAPDQRAHEIRVPGRLGRHGDHDVRGALRRRRSEQRARMALEQGRPALEVDRQVARHAVHPTADARERGQHGLDAGQRVGLGPPERGETERSEWALQVAQVEAAQRDVVRQVAGARAPSGVDAADVVAERALDGQRAVAQALHLERAAPQDRGSVVVRHGSEGWWEFAVVWGAVPPGGGGGVRKPPQSLCVARLRAQSP